MSLLILKRVAESDDYYLLNLLDIEKKENIFRFLSKEVNEIVINPCIEDQIFYDYDTEKKIELTKCDSIEKVQIPSRYKIHRFDPSPIGLRKMTYSIYDKETDSLFVPCCGKNRMNDKIKKKWGRYRNDYEFMGYQLEGYLVNNKRNFDQFILRFNDSMLKIRFIGESQLLIKEFFDYLGIEGTVESLEKLNDKEFILRIKD